MSKTVLVGVTSGIAAFKALQLIKELKDEKLDVYVIMSASATQMVPLVEFENASGHPVVTELFTKDFDYKKVLESRRVEHIELADMADLMVILPATANTIAKLATGMADNYLTTTALAVTAPVLVCPSMNVHMWQHPAVQENIGKLQKLGYQIIEPATGMLACGYEGQGRLAEIAVIKAAVMASLKRTNSLQGKKVLISAGGTIEKIDDVRYITNKSSGKMGVALAEECYVRGAEVILLRSKTAVKPRYLMTEHEFETADDLLENIRSEIRAVDIFFHTAAVSDFEVTQNINGKISSHQATTLELKPRQKILDQIKKLNPQVLLVPFKAEFSLSDEELLKVAQQRLHEADADAIIANDISQSDRGFQADTNEVVVITKDGGVQKLPLTTKKIIAKQIIDTLQPMLNTKTPS